MCVFIMESIVGATNLVDVKTMSVLFGVDDLSAYHLNASIQGFIRVLCQL